MKKSDLRTLFLERRRSLSVAERHLASQKIADIFFDLAALTPVRTIHCFISIEKFFEVDTSIIFGRFWSEFTEIRTTAPRLNFDTGELENVLVGPETKIVRNRWGIDEPFDSDVVDVREIDMILVPLLAFDVRGFRVGYGKGFYDRLLSQSRPDCLKSGLELLSGGQRDRGQI